MPTVAAQLEEHRSRLEGYWSEYDDIQTKLELLDEAEASFALHSKKPFMLY